jgi:hypothetical protein
MDLQKERKNKKGKKGREQIRQVQYQENKSQPKQLQQQRKGPLTAADIKVETPQCSDETPSPSAAQKEDDGNSSGEEERQALEADDVRLVPDADILAALTGQPDPEDVLLCAIPMCAPYSTLSKYK